MFTFKTTKPTGRYRSFYPSHHEVKVKRLVCGTISDGEGYRIRLYVKDEHQKSGFRPILFKKTSNSLDEAKTFLKKHYDNIIEKYSLHFLPNE